MGRNGLKKHNVDGNTEITIKCHTLKIIFLDDLVRLFCADTNNYNKIIIILEQELAGKVITA